MSTIKLINFTNNIAYNIIIIIIEEILYIIIYQYETIHNNLKLVKIVGKFH